MLLTPYRRTVQALLHGIPALRKPFLRRSRRPDALLTTDLPRRTAPESLAWLIAALEAQGWTALRQGDYLELTPGLVPPAPGGRVFAAVLLGRAIHRSGGRGCCQKALVYLAVHCA